MNNSLGEIELLQPSNMDFCNFDEITNLFLNFFCFSDKRPRLGFVSFGWARIRSQGSRCEVHFAIFVFDYKKRETTNSCLVSTTIVSSRQFLTWVVNIRPQVKAVGGWKQGALSKQ